MAEKNLNNSFTDQIPELLPGVDWDTGLAPIEPNENGELFCYCKKVIIIRFIIIRFFFFC